MSQTVEIPDQGIAEFPDEMTPDQIKGVIKDKFYSQPTTIATPQQPIIPRSGMQTDVEEAHQFANEPVVQNAIAAAGDIAKSVPSMVAGLPKAAYQGLKFAAGGQKERTEVAGELLKEAIPQGVTLAKMLQSPVGSREWDVAAAQVGLMALPAVGMVGEALSAAKPPIQLRETLFGTKPTTGTLSETLGFKKPEPTLPTAEQITTEGVPNAVQNIETAQPNGVRAEPQVPQEIVPPAASVGGEGVPEVRQGEEVPGGAPKEPVAPTAETPTATGEVTPQGQATPPAAAGQGAEPPIIGKDVTKDIPDFPPEAKTTGLTQDFISKDREARGEQPLAKQARQTNPETWDKSAQTFQSNPNAGHELVADLIRNPHPINQDDLGILLRHRVNLTNETDLNFQRLTDPNATPGQKGDALTKLAALRDARNDADTAVQTQGSTTGRTLQFLKSLSDQDYSLSGIGQQRTAAMGGKELTPIEQEKFAKENSEWSREILEKDAALQNYLKTNARQESALKAYKTRLKTATTETERRIAFSDYAPEIRRQMELDPEAVKLKGEAEAVKQRFQEQLLKDQLANRPWWQKVLGGVAWTARESALSGYHTLVKLAGFTGGQLVRIPLTQTAERMWGTIPGFRDIAAQSEFGPGASAQALGKLYSTFFRTAMDQAKKVLTTGKGDYTMQYEEGKRPMQYPSFFGRLHGFEKYPLREGSTAMNRQRIIDTTMDRLASESVSKGEDITDPIVQAGINKLAFDAGTRDILMNNNLFADKINGMLSSMEGKQKATGEPSVEMNILAALAKTFLTKGIVRTPANFVTQVFEHTPIGLGRGLAKAIRANYKGVENIPAPQRTAIMRLLGAGSVGSGMFLWGALDALRPPDQRIFGGYYQPGEKRDGSDVKFASVRLGGLTAPHYLTHNLLSEPAQMGNTLMRVATSSWSKKDRTNKGLVAGALASTLGLAEQAPIANPAFRMGKLTDPRQQTSYLADLVRGLIPQLVQNIAMDMDKSDVQRKPSGLGETLRLGIPGLRQTVPEKTARTSKNVPYNP